MPLWLRKSRAPIEHVTFQGFPVSIESPVGSVRKWTDHQTGETGETTMRHAYGYVRQSEGMDGEGVDCFLGPDEGASHAYIVRQVRPETGEMDEDKVMLGFSDEPAARAAYLAHYTRPDFLGLVIPMPVEEFRRKVHATKDAPGIVRVGATVAQKSEDSALPAGQPFVARVHRGERERPKTAEYATDPGDLGAGRYHTTNIHYARAYAGKLGTVHSGVVALRRALILHSDAAVALASKYKTVEGRTQEERLAGARQMTGDLKAKGYDGLVVHGYEGGAGATSVVVFDPPTQKSQRLMLKARV